MIRHHIQVKTRYLVAGMEESICDRDDKIRLITICHTPENLLGGRSFLSVAAGSWFYSCLSPTSLISPHTPWPADGQFQHIQSTPSKAMWVLETSGMELSLNLFPRSWHSDVVGVFLCIANTFPAIEKVLDNIFWTTLNFMAHQILLKYIIIF